MRSFLINLARKSNTFFSSGTRVKRYFFEALFTSAYVRFTLSFMPFKKVMEWLGNNKFIQITHLDYTENDWITIRSVRTAVEWCNKYSFWKTECYTRALTAKIMLRRRGIGSCLSIGFKKEDDGSYKGHAWLKCSNYFVTGKLPEITEFLVHANFT